VGFADYFTLCCFLQQEYSLVMRVWLLLNVVQSGNLTYNIKRSTLTQLKMI